MCDLIARTGWCPYYYYDNTEVSVSQAFCVVVLVGKRSWCVVFLRKDLLFITETNHCCWWGKYCSFCRRLDESLWVFKRCAIKMWHTFKVMFIMFYIKVFVLLLCIHVPLRPFGPIYSFNLLVVDAFYVVFLSNLEVVTKSKFNFKQIRIVDCFLQYLPFSFRCLITFISYR